MLTGLLSLGLLVLLSQSAAQTINLKFNKSLTTSACDAPSTIIAGERIILTATLDSSHSNRSDWPLDQILLQVLNPILVNICHINIERDGCRGFRPDLCGYCDRQEGELYHLIFNLTSDAFGSLYARFRCMWVGAPSFITYSIEYVVVAIQDDVYLTTHFEQSTRFSSGTNQTASESVILFSTVPNVYFPGMLTWRLSNTVGLRQAYYNQVYYNVSQWDEHIDDVISLDYTDPCGRNWSFTTPVTDRPVALCDLPVITWRNSTGAQVVFTCRFSTPWIIPEVNCYSELPLRKRTVSIDGDLVTCTIDIYGSFTRLNSRIEIDSLLDIQFTNDTQQSPRVVRFNVNGSRSVTVEPGANITFECKVYGNPGARSVLVGPRTSRIQEYLSTTDLIGYTLTDVQCQDTGRYRCKGVSGFGATARERQGYVDVNVRCPTAIKSHVPSNKDRKFNFDPDSAVLIALEVYGYPAPTQFGLQVQQGSTSVNVSTDRYTVRYSDLDPSQGLVSLLMTSEKSEGPKIYVFSISNGYNMSVDFQFQLGGVAEESQSPWLYAFIAVICAFIVFIAVIIILYLVKKHGNKKGEDSNFNDLRPGESELSEDRRKKAKDNRYELQSSSCVTARQRRQDTEHPVPIPGVGNTLDYQNMDQDEVYENVTAEDVYEIPVQ